MQDEQLPSEICTIQKGLSARNRLTVNSQNFFPQMGNLRSFMNEIINTCGRAYEIR